jgi:phospholipase/carboxylesterase
MEQSIPAPAPGNPQDAPARLATVEVVTGPQPTHSVIWLHGLGADGHDFEPIVPELELQGRAVRFVFPHAPERPVTINAGMRMRAWYDIHSLSTSRDQDVAGITKSTEQVSALIQRERERGIPAANIVLAGFSQGGAMAIHVALRYPERLAGLVSLSGYLLFPERLQVETHAANRDLSVFVAHGTQDPVVPCAMGREAARVLQSLAHEVSFYEYPMPHSVSLPEIKDIGAWLRGRLFAAETR